jgi:thiamine-phosphate pyrophosphorylase
MASSRIYLVVPPLPGESAVEALASVLAAEPIGCVLLAAETVQAAAEDFTRQLISLTQKRGIAVLLEDDAEAAKRLGADGVHFAAVSREAILHAKSLLGQDAPVGAACRLSRHEAMVAAEAGADYVAFQADEAGAVAEMAAWCEELFVVPCVAWHQGGLDEARQLALAGASFIAVNGIIWQQEETPAAAIRSLFRAISL